MKEENQIKIIKLGVGCFLVSLYAITGVNGIILLFAAFLFGLPIEEFIKQYKKD